MILGAIVCVDAVPALGAHRDDLGATEHDQRVLIAFAKPPVAGAAPVRHREPRRMIDTAVLEVLSPGPRTLSAPLHGFDDLVQLGTLRRWD
jgi:hypothetical protein